MTTPILYSIDGSPPCRAVLMLAKAIGLKLDTKLVNLLEQEHLQPDFVKINPQHTVPTLDDDGFILWDSHAISLYLLEKYGKVDDLYSRDLKTKALIDQRLHFHSSIVFGVLLRIGKPIRLKQTKIVPENLKADLREIYDFLNTFLEGKEWTCGDKVTVADIHLVATISSLQLFEPITEKYPNVIRWLNNATQQPWYEANIKGLNEFNQIFTEFMSAK